MIEVQPQASGDWRNRLEEILDLLPVGVEIYDAGLNALFFNRKADDLFLYPERPVLQHDDWFELGFPDPEERARRYAEWLDRVERRGGSATGSRSPSGTCAAATAATTSSSS